MSIKRSLLLAIALLYCLPLVAQKYACVNTDRVLKNIPDYIQAQKRLDKYVADWQAELDQKYQEVEQLRLAYQQESYLLPDNLKKRREEEIKSKNDEILLLQQKYFSPGGELDKKRDELMKPVQDRVFAAIQRLAQEKNYAFVFDRSASSTVLFANEKYDITDQVLEMLGYHAGNAASDDASSPSKSKSKAKSPASNADGKDRGQQPLKSRSNAKTLKP